MLAYAGAASQGDLPPSPRRARNAPDKTQPPPTGSGRNLFPKLFGLTSWVSEDAANCLLSHYPARGLRGPDVALRIFLRIS